MSNEAYFNLNGVINKQKLYYWAPENPRKIYQKSLQLQLLLLSAQSLLLALTFLQMETAQQLHKILNITVICCKFSCGDIIKEGEMFISNKMVP